jgi:hypothetical protein
MTTLAYALLDPGDATNTVGGAIAGLLLLIFIVVGSAVGIALYLLPLIVAVMRKSHLIGPVAAVNILLGWSLIGWVGALVLALMPKQQATTVIVHNNAPQPQSVERYAGTLSEDGRWRWDGQRWQSTRSELPAPPDGQAVSVSAADGGAQ